jgi:hypothetical protein
MTIETEIPAPVSATVQAIYAHHERARGEQYDSYGIGFSALGEECDRRLWYDFHWSTAGQPIDGKKARLFDTGKREEDRLIAELRAIGVDIRNEQEKLRLCDGHLRGKIECTAIGLPEAPKTEHAIEIKTHQNVKFNALVKHGVRKNHEKHYIQLMLGAHAKGLQRGMYIANCKNSDDIHAVRFALDPVEVASWLARAERIIYAATPPKKLHEDPTTKAAWGCKVCPARGVCHGGEWPRINCRTCYASEPVKGGDGRWHCVKHRRDLTMAEQKTGCADHRYIPDLVPGVRTDCDMTTETISYALHTGATWHDRGCAVGDDGRMAKL